MAAAASVHANSVPRPAPANRSLINVSDAGAKGDGITDDTAAIQAAINGGTTIFFPRGTYLVKINRITLPDGVTLCGENGLSVIKTNDAPDVSLALLKAVGKKNITIESMGFATPQSIQTALLFASCANVTIRNCQAVNCQLIYIGSSAVALLHANIDSANAFFDIYSKVEKPEHYSSNIFIDGNTCVGDGVKGRGGRGLSGIFISYANNVKICNNDLTKYVHGITWWGGNANTGGPAPNGEIYNARKCNGLTITGNTIHDVEMGGIWGSMGERVSVTGNSVAGCGDVGIDFEGCIDATATGNTVQACTTACLCTCFNNRGIVFSGNSCAQRVNGSYIAYIQNLLKSEGNLSVSFIGNSFTSNTGLSHVVSQGVRTFIFEGNLLHNVTVNLPKKVSANSTQVISGNTFYFDAISKSPLTALNFENETNDGQLIISGNSFHCAVPQPKGSSCIVSKFNTSSTHCQITNNVYSGLNYLGEYNHAAQ